MLPLFIKDKVQLLFSGILHNLYVKNAFHKAIQFYWGRGLAYLAPAVAFYILLLLPALLLGLAFLAGLLFPEEINSGEVSSLVADRFVPELRNPILRFSESVFSGRVLLLSVPLMIWTLSAVLALLDRVMSPMPERTLLLLLGRARLLLLAALLLFLLLLTLALPVPDILVLPLLWGGLAMIYKMLPLRENRPSWKDALLGALPAAALLFIAPRLFALYLSFTSFSAAGGLAGLVLFLLSAYLLAFALLLGAGLASQKTFQKDSSRSVHDAN